MTTLECILLVYFLGTLLCYFIVSIVILVRLYEHTFNFRAYSVVQIEQVDRLIRYLFYGCYVWPITLILYLKYLYSSR